MGTGVKLFIKAFSEWSVVKIGDLSTDWLQNQLNYPLFGMIIVYNYNPSPIFNPHSTRFQEKFAQTEEDQTIVLSNSFFYYFMIIGLRF